MPLYSPQETLIWFAERFHDPIRRDSHDIKAFCYSFNCLMMIAVDR